MGQLIDKIIKKAAGRLGWSLLAVSQDWEHEKETQNQDTTHLSHHEYIRWIVYNSSYKAYCEKNNRFNDKAGGR